MPICRLRFIQIFRSICALFGKIRSSSQVSSLRSKHSTSGVQKIAKAGSGLSEEKRCLTIYLDDILLIRTKVRETRQFTEMATTLLESLGFIINRDKSILNPTREVHQASKRSWGGVWYATEKRFHVNILELKGAFFEL